MAAFVMSGGLKDAFCHGRTGAWKGLEKRV